MVNLGQVTEWIKKGDTDALRKVLQEQPEIVQTNSPTGVSLLQFAAYCRNNEAITLLRPLSEPISFFEATSIGDFEAMESALKSDPNLLNTHSIDGFTGLGFASFFGHVELVRFLLSEGASPNIPAANAISVSPIHSACAASNYEIAKLLLEAGANPNVKQQQDLTPLHSAAHHRELALVQLLLSYHADISARSTQGQTPAQMAQEVGWDEGVSLLS